MLGCETTIIWSVPRGDIYKNIPSAMPLWYITKSGQEPQCAPATGAVVASVCVAYRAATAKRRGVATLPMWEECLPGWAQVHADGCVARRSVGCSPPTGSRPA